MPLVKGTKGTLRESRELQRHYLVDQWIKISPFWLFVYTPSYLDQGQGTVTAHVLSDGLEQSWTLETPEKVLLYPLADDHPRTRSD